MKKLIAFIFNRIRYATVKRFMKSQIRRSNRTINSLGQKEQDIIRIVKSALVNKRNRLTILPGSGNREILGQKNEMAITISHNRIIIRDHKNHYDLYVGSELSGYLTRRVNRVMQRQRSLIDRDLTNSLNKGLSDLANNLNKKRKINGSKVNQKLRGQLRKASSETSIHL